MLDLGLLPKALLHVHLESAVRWSTLRELAAGNGAPLPVPAGPTSFDGFRAFADHGSAVRGCLREPGDFERVAYELCADLAADGVRYAEVTFTAASHGERLGDLRMPLASVVAGLARGQVEFGVVCGVVLDHSRRRSVRRAWRTVELAREFAGRGVVAVGAAGDEAHSLAPFAGVWAAAREAGLRVVHHAGETAGAASVAEAVGVGLAERIGHGIGVVGDRELVARLRAERIGLEVCPSSNVGLGLVESWARHPLPELVAAGLVVTLATDVPRVVGTSLTREFELAREVFGFSDGELVGLARAGFEVAFAAESVRVGLLAEFDRWCAAHGVPVGGGR